MSKTILRFDKAEDLLHKMKYILWDGKNEVSQNSFILNAIRTEIEKYETEHGNITEKKLKDARIK